MISTIRPAASNYAIAFRHRSAEIKQSIANGSQIRPCVVLLHHQSSGHSRWEMLKYGQQKHCNVLRRARRLPSFMLFTNLAQRKRQNARIRLKTLSLLVPCPSSCPCLQSTPTLSAPKIEHCGLMGINILKYTGLYFRSYTCISSARKENLGSETRF